MKKEYIVPETEVNTLVLDIEISKKSFGDQGQGPIHSRKRQGDFDEEEDDSESGSSIW